MQRMTPPAEGIYESTRRALGMRFVVSNVTHGFDDLDNNGEYCMLELIDEASAAEVDAIADELMYDEWIERVERYGLIYKGPR
jgi:hypothetical protein